MKLNRIDHIGVIVDDIDEAKALLGQGFGLEPGPVVDREDLRTAFFTCGDVSIEVIQLADPEARRVRLGDGQRARIEHIAIEVDDLDATLRALEALGVRPNAPPRLSGSRLTVWTDPESSDGVMYQFVQKEPAPPAERTGS